MNIHYTFLSEGSKPGNERPLNCTKAQVIKYKCHKTKIGLCFKMGCLYLIASKLFGLQVRYIELDPI